MDHVGTSLVCCRPNADIETPHLRSGATCLAIKSETHFLGNEFWAYFGTMVERAEDPEEDEIGPCITYDSVDIQTSLPGSLVRRPPIEWPASVSEIGIDWSNNLTPTS